MRRGKHKTKYARRDRDWQYMEWIKRQRCCVPESFPDATPCSGGPLDFVEADHSVNAGLSNKGADRATIPLCNGHHRERTDHVGTFANVPLDIEREWRAQMVSEHNARYAAERSSSFPF